MTESRLRIHGLNLRSSIDLYQRRPTVSAEDDIVVEWASPGRETPDRLDGSVIAEAGIGDQALYTVVRDGGGRFTCRFNGICDFEVNAELDRATCVLARGAKPDLVPVLAAGSLLATMLTLREQLVLHASAVVDGGRALAFVGQSGMGKSTLATLLALAGAPLLTDDVLRVALEPIPSGYAGATETRLRTEAHAIVPARAAVRPTADGRTAVSLAIAAQDCVPLGCIVVPFPSKDAGGLRVTRLSARDALLLLMRFPRVLGWQDKPTLIANFTKLAELVDAVPVVTADIPWGPPFPDGLATSLLRLLQD